MSFHIAPRRELVIGLAGVASGVAVLLSAIVADESNGWQAVGTTSTVSAECPDSNGWQCASL